MITELPQTNGNIRFPSLTAVKTANNDLLKRRSNVDDPEAFLTDVAAFIQKGVATGAILNVESDRWTCQSIVDYWTNFLDRYDHDTAPTDALLVPFDEKLAIDIPESKCPYVGLEAFRESKQQLFFGRERLITELLQKVSTSRCLAIIGSSGSGKSSLVLAGVVPALKAGAYDRSKQWQYLPTIVPGVDPLASLVSLIPRPADVREEEWVAEQVRGLMQSNSHLCELINRNNFEAAFIVVDQFEELFTLTLDETVQKAFIANLLSLAEYPDLRHTLILTMRSEFESYIAKSPELAKYFAQGVRITPLTAAEVREAIQKPAELVGLKFKTGSLTNL
jgi:energy-coupling factor transporter ATP-binding protein EcfA2